MVMNSKQLLQSYRSLWKNRELIHAEENAEKVLIEAITRELRDENAHPRVRKDKPTKLVSSIKRVSQSSLKDDEKVALIEKYISIFDQID